jgi:hypothetical protein
MSRFARQLTGSLTNNEQRPTTNEKRTTKNEQQVIYFAIQILLSGVAST